MKTKLVVYLIIWVCLKIAENELSTASFDLEYYWTYVDRKLNRKLKKIIIVCIEGISTDFYHTN